MAAMQARTHAHTHTHTHTHTITFHKRMVIKRILTSFKINGITVVTFFGGYKVIINFGTASPGTANVHHLIKKSAALQNQTFKEQ